MKFSKTRLVRIDETIIIQLLVQLVEDKFFKVSPHGDVMKEVDKEWSTYLGIVELDKIKKNKGKATKKYKRLLWLVLKSKLNGRYK